MQDDKEEKKEVPVQMRKRITLLIAALMMALTMSFGSVAAFAAIERDADTRGGGGNPQGGGKGLIIECENPSGKAPKGQNDPDKC